MKLFSTILGFSMLLLGALPMRAQERITVPFRDASMPRKLVINGMIGDVKVTGYNGQEAIVVMTGDAARQVRRRAEVPAGMRRIGGNAGLEVTEENNVIRVSGGGWMGRADLEIQVPTQTSVSVKTMNSSDGIHIENITGEIEVESMNGDVNIVNASGSVMAHSNNGEVKVSLNSVAADKPMSFSTMNGEIDVTLPATIKANVKMKTNRGEMFTDFDVQLDPTRAAAQTETTGRNGRVFRVRTDSSTYGTINGGGPEIQFTTFNGNILLRKK